jgi:hypothetical protein
MLKEKGGHFFAAQSESRISAPFFASKTAIFLFLSILLSPYKPEISMIRSCPDRLEFKNECYSTVNQSISKKQRYLQ